MFSLDNQNVLVTSVSGNGENHGTEIKLGMTVAVKFTVGNTILNQFGDNYLQALYERGPEDDADLDAQGKPDLLPVMRIPNMKPLGIKWDGAGYRVIFHQGLSGDEDIILIQSAIDSVVFDCKQGGSVEVALKIKCHPFEAEDRGALLGLIKQPCDITLEPPSAEDIAQMELDAAAGDEDDEPDTDNLLD